MKDSQAGRFDVVLAEALDRQSRGQEDTARITSENEAARKNDGRRDHVLYAPCVRRVTALDTVPALIQTHAA